MSRVEPPPGAGEVRERIEAARRIVLTTHVQPDGDGIGSQTALARHLVTLGKQVTVLNPHATQPRYRFLEPVPPILVFEPARAETILSETDLLIVMDISVPSRLGPMGDLVEAFDGDLIVIDHHVGPSGFDGVDCRDTSAAATAEIVYRLLITWDAPISPEIATALYAAMAFDTGGFRYTNTHAGTHEIAADLMRRGADAEAVARHLFESMSLAQIRLLGRAYREFVLSPRGRVASVVVSQEMMSETGATIGDLEGIVEALRSIEGVDVGILAKEVRAGVTKLSFRSTTDHDVRAFAERFGGGGHRNAAGAFLEEPIEDVVPRVLAAATDAFDPPPAGDGGIPGDA